MAPQLYGRQITRGDLGDDLVDHLGRRRERLAVRGDVVTGQLDRVHRQATVRAAPGPSVRSSPRFHLRTESTPRALACAPFDSDPFDSDRACNSSDCLSDLPSTTSARSARIGCRVSSLRDTTRSRLTASFTADSEVPPRSKK